MGKQNESGSAMTGAWRTSKACNDRDMQIESGSAMTGTCRMYQAVQ